MKVVILGQALIHAPVAWGADLRALTEGADAVICNFEGCLPPPGAWAMKSKTVHAAHPDALAMLRDLGVTHLALANNHLWDFGHAGVLSTVAAARGAGFATAGAGGNRTEAAAFAAASGVALLAVDAGPTPDWAIAGTHPGVNGLDLRMSLGLPAGDIARLRAISEITGEAERRRRRGAIGYDAGDGSGAFYGLKVTEAEVPGEIWTVAPEALSQLAGAIRAARRAADLVVVSVHYHHWRPDWSGPPIWVQGLAEALIGMGADCVAATGPPVAYPSERLGDRAASLGLGNLVFHTARGAHYDALGLPVWAGRALVFDGGVWSERGVEVLRPE